MFSQSLMLSPFARSRTVLHLVELLVQVLGLLLFSIQAGSVHSTQR